MIATQIIETALYLVFLALIAISDFRCRRIPNRLLTLMTVVRLICLTARGSGSEAAGSLATFLLTVILCVLCAGALNKRTGPGDIKLLLASAFCMGIDLYLHALICTGILLAVVLCLTFIRKRPVPYIPFAPYFFFGTLIALVLL